MTDTIESLRQQLADLTNVHNQTVSNGIAGFEAIKQQLAECQATNGKLREALEFLWNIIDDIDTYSDMAKFDNSLFRTLVERRQADRWKTGITTDGYSLNIPAIPNDATALNELIAERTASLTAEVERLKTVPMKYRRMAFNAQLQDENNQLRQQNAELTAQRDAAMNRLAWIERKLFVSSWNGVVGNGNATTWSIAGDWRHTVAALKKDDFGESIDAAIINHEEQDENRSE